MRNITKKDYLEEVKALAFQIIEESINWEKDILVVVRETIEWHQWVIYDAYHEDILSLTSNYEAYQDLYEDAKLGAIVKKNGLDHVKKIQASFAFEQDVRDAIYEIDFSDFEGPDFTEEQFKEVKA